MFRGLAVVSVVAWARSIYASFSETTRTIEERMFAQLFASKARTC